MITGTVNYLGSSNFNDVRTIYEQVEIATDGNELVRLGSVTADTETRRVLEPGNRVTLYFSALGDKNDGSASSCDIWAARDDESGRVFVSRTLKDTRTTWKIHVAKYVLLSPFGLLVFVVGFIAALVWAWAGYQILKRLPTQLELDAAAELLRERTPAPSLLVGGDHVVV